MTRQQIFQGFSLVVALIVAAPFASGQTQHYGVYTTDRVWAATDSPHVIFHSPVILGKIASDQSENVRVTLTIEPGSVVVIPDGEYIEVCNGRLVAEGVTFVSEEAFGINAYGLRGTEFEPWDPQPEEQIIDLTNCTIDERLPVDAGTADLVVRDCEFAQTVRVGGSLTAQNTVFANQTALSIAPGASLGDTSQIVLTHADPVVEISGESWLTDSTIAMFGGLDRYVLRNSWVRGDNGERGTLRFSPGTVVEMRGKLTVDESDLFMEGVSFLTDGSPAWIDGEYSGDIELVDCSGGVSVKGYRNLRLTGCDIGGEVYARYGIAGCEITDCTIGQTLTLEGSAPVVTGCGLNGSPAIKFSPTADIRGVHGNTYGGAEPDWLMAGGLDSTDEPVERTIPLIEGPGVYRLGYVSVNEWGSGRSTLLFDPGVVFETESNSRLIVHSGAVIAEGVEFRAGTGHTGLPISTDQNYSPSSKRAELKFIGCTFPSGTSFDIDKGSLEIVGSEIDGTISAFCDRLRLADCVLGGTPPVSSAPTTEFWGVSGIGYTGEPREWEITGGIVVGTNRFADNGSGYLVTGPLRVGLSGQPGSLTIGPNARLRFPSPFDLRADAGLLDIIDSEIVGPPEYFGLISWNPAEGHGSIVRSTIRAMAVDVSPNAPTVECVNLLDGSLAIAQGPAGLVLPFGDVYWGTTDPAQISGLIYDGADGLDRPTLDFVPFLSEACTDTANGCAADVNTRNVNPGEPGYGEPDGVVDGADLSYFVEAWLSMNAGVADVNTKNTNPGAPGYGEPDGVVDGADLSYFVERWLGGCN